MSSFEPLRELAELAQLQDELDEVFALGPGTLDAFVPGISAWSSAQHLAHVALANELVLRNLRSLATGQGMLLVTGSATDPRSLEVLAAGRLPRGRAQAPRMVRPPERIEHALLAQWLADGRAARVALDAHALRAGDPKIPHQLLGPLDGPQWARFAVVHTRHHLGIVREILALPDASGDRSAELPAPR